MDIPRPSVFERVFRHRFTVLLFVDMRNDLISQNQTNHLNKYKAEVSARRTSKPYACNKKGVKATKK